MVIVKILGGLGNQMFQYAYANALKQKGYNVKLDITGFHNYSLHGGYHLNNYNVTIDVATENEILFIKKKNYFKNILRQLCLKNKIILKERTLLFNNKFLSISDNTYVEGYFQSEKYFNSIRNSILESFTLINPISSYGVSISEKIISLKNTCSIHIRRGDYLNDVNKNIFGTCSLNYYKDAISHIEKNIPNITFFIFSNDIEWSKDNINVKHAVYIDNSSRIPNEDIYLMSLCKHNIIANSSFSWWGSWLNTNKHKIVIAPKNWFIDSKLFSESLDIIPKNYIQL